MGREACNSVQGEASEQRILYAGAGAQQKGVARRTHATGDHISRWVCGRRAVALQQVPVQAALLRQGGAGAAAGGGGGRVPGTPAGGNSGGTITGYCVFLNQLGENMTGERGDLERGGAAGAAPPVTGTCRPCATSQPRRRRPPAPGTRTPPRPGARSILFCGRPKRTWSSWGVCRRGDAGRVGGAQAARSSKARPSLPIMVASSWE